VQRHTKNSEGPWEGAVARLAAISNCRRRRRGGQDGGPNEISNGSAKMSALKAA
jgi:hypothetical protein